MNLVVYADESGTHGDNGKSQGNEFALIAGWIAYQNVWETFSKEWASILKKKDVTHFHASAFAQASAIKRDPDKRVPSNYSKNPFKHLTVKEMDELRNALALLLINPQIEFECAIFDHKKYLEERDTLTDEIAKLFINDPLNYLIHDFFKLVFKRIDRVCGGNQPIEFIFDDCQETEWQNRIRIVAEAYKSYGVQIVNLSFQSQHKAMPIQAADMAAHRNNQVARNATAGITKDRSKLDVFDLMMAERVKKDLARVKIIAPFAQGFNLPSGFA